MRTAALTAPLLVLALLVTASPAAAKRKPTALAMTSRSVDLSGKVTIKLVQKTTKKLLELDAISHDPIFLTVNADGDSIEAALALVDTIRALASPVHAVVQSRAYDAAALVTVFCEKTWVYPHAVFLLRPIDAPSAEFKPPAKPPEAFMTAYRDLVYESVARSLDMKPKAYAEKVKEGWWLTAEEALEVGLADVRVDALSYRELFIEKTEIKKTVTTIKKKQRRSEGGKPEVKKGRGEK